MEISRETKTDIRKWLAKKYPKATESDIALTLARIMGVYTVHNGHGIKTNSEVMSEAWFVATVEDSFYG
jgi:hypothetical protein